MFSTILLNESIVDRVSVAPITYSMQRKQLIRPREDF